MEMNDFQHQMLGPQAALIAQAVQEAMMSDNTLSPAFAANYTPDVTGKEEVTILFPLTANTTIGAPIGARAGQRLVFVFAATGVFTVTWNAVFKAAANGAAAAGQYGATAFVYNGTVWVQEAGALGYK
jgi:hypothetical protein